MSDIVWKAYQKIEELSDKKCDPVLLDTVARELSTSKDIVVQCATALHILDLVSFCDETRELVVPRTSHSIERSTY